MLKWPQTTNMTFWLHAKSASVRMMIIDRKRSSCKNRTVEVPNLELKNNACVADDWSVDPFCNKFSVLSFIKGRASRVAGSHLLAGDKYQHYVRVILVHPCLSNCDGNWWLGEDLSLSLLFLSTLVAHPCAVIHLYHRLRVCRVVFAVVSSTTPVNTLMFCE